MACSGKSDVDQHLQPAVDKGEKSIRHDARRGKIFVFRKARSRVAAKAKADPKAAASYGAALFLLLRGRERCAGTFLTGTLC